MRPKTLIATLALAGMASLPVTSSATGLGSHSPAAYDGLNTRSEQAFDEGRHYQDSQQLGGYMDPDLGSNMTFETLTLQETWYHPDGTVVYYYPDWTIVGHADVDPFDYSTAGMFGDESLDGIQLGEYGLTEPSVSSGASSDAISSHTASESDSLGSDWRIS